MFWSCHEPLESFLPLTCPSHSLSPSPSSSSPPQFPSLPFSPTTNPSPPSPTSPFVAMLEQTARLAYVLRCPRSRTQPPIDGECLVDMSPAPHPTPPLWISTPSPGLGARTSASEWIARGSRLSTADRTREGRGRHLTSPHLIRLSLFPIITIPAHLHPRLRPRRQGLPIEPTSSTSAHDLAPKP